LKIYYCLDCGKIIERHAKRCRKCAAKIRGLKRLSGEIVKCAYCNKEIYQSKCLLELYKIHFCDNLCKGKWQINRGKLENNTNWRGGKLIACLICGKKVWRTPFRIKNLTKNLVFCSPQCHGVWKSRELKGKNAINFGKKHSLSVKQAQSVLAKKCWKDPEFITKQMKSRNVHPNKPENQLIDLFGFLSLPYKYTGDGQFILGGKCPDFVNVNGQKKIIEMFGDFWHKDENPNDRMAIFEPFGFKTLVIWEHELKDLESVKQRILEFDRS
jgi:G:T-mismatch repair DNA endonuclease (very short patch repair protein)